MAISRESRVGFLKSLWQQEEMMGTRVTVAEKGEGLDESGQEWELGSDHLRQDPQDQVMDGCVTACRVGEEAECEGGDGCQVLGFWPEYFTDIENSRSLHESLHSVSVPTL